MPRVAGVVIPSQFGVCRKPRGSDTVPALDGLWMNLCKLWIVEKLLNCATNTMRRPRAHASMVAMNASEGEVTSVDIANVPQSFGEPGQSGETGANAVLLDVREDDEWQRGHVAGAQHIPMGDVPARLAELDTDATLYVVCHAGGRSLRVAQYLARNGFEPVNVDGGMLAWAGAGRPVVTDDGSVGTV